MAFVPAQPPPLESYPYPGVCEDRPHDCKGNVLSEEQRVHSVRGGPGTHPCIGKPDRIADFLARYVRCLTRWNAERLNPVGSINPVEALHRIRGP